MEPATLLPGRKSGFRLRVSHNPESGPPCSEGRFGVSSGSSFGDRFGGLFSSHFWVGWGGALGGSFGAGFEDLGGGFGVAEAERNGI